MFHYELCTVALHVRSRLLASNDFYKFALLIKSPSMTFCIRRFFSAVLDQCRSLSECRVTCAGSPAVDQIDMHAGERSAIECPAEYQLQRNVVVVTLSDNERLRPLLTCEVSVSYRHVRRFLETMMAG